MSQSGDFEMTPSRDELDESMFDALLPQTTNDNWERHVGEQPVHSVDECVSPSQVVGQYTYTGENGITHGITLCFNTDPGFDQWCVTWNVDDTELQGKLQGHNQIWNDPHPEAKRTINTLLDNIVENLSLADVGDIIHASSHSHSEK